MINIHSIRPHRPPRMDTQKEHHRIEKLRKETHEMLRQEVKERTPPTHGEIFASFIDAITAPTEAQKWLSSPAVTAWCEERIKEREQEEQNAR